MTRQTGENAERYYDDTKAERKQSLQLEAELNKQHVPELQDGGTRQEINPTCSEGKLTSLLICGLLPDGRSLRNSVSS